MNSGVRKSGGRVVIEILLAIAIAVFAPLSVMSELLTARMVLVLPVIGYVFLKNYAGKKIALLSSLLTLLFSVLMLGANVALMLFAMSFIPQIVMQALEKKGFGSRMTAALVSFVIGAVLAVVVIYIAFGGNMIERYLGSVPQMLREITAELPEENAAMLLEMLSGMLNTEIASMDAVHLLFEESIQKLIPVYQLNMPGMLFSGAILSGVISVWLDGYMKFRKGDTSREVYIPVREWYLPSSTTGGLILIFAVSLIMNYSSMQQGPAVFATIYHIAVTAFGIQAFASVRRKVHTIPKKAAGMLFTLGFFAIALLSSPILALYGVASAVLGSGGALKQCLDAKMGQNREDARNKEDDNEEDK